MHHHRVTGRRAKGEPERDVLHKRRHIDQREKVDKEDQSD
jgi:hypothetical protein